MLLVVVAIGIAVLYNVYLIGVKDADAFKAEAVQRGFATWVADEYGNTTFTWKEPTP